MNKKELSLYGEHVETMRNRYDKIMDEFGISEIVIASGVIDYYFADDRPVVFKSTPHFAHWCPLEGPGHLLQVCKNKKPKLIFFSPNDYWDLAPTADGKPWLKNFDVQLETELANRFNHFIESSSTPWFIGSDSQIPTNYSVNDEKLTKALDWNRSFKTPWEVHCIRTANKIAAAGHLRSKELFVESQSSEFDILMEFCVATGYASHELPYNPIIAFDEHAATLHYEQKLKIKKATTLLIDAGVNYYGYASDITRTHLTTNKRESIQRRVISEKAHQVFSNLLTKLNQFQIKFVSAIEPGDSYVDLHKETCLAIYEILSQEKIILSCPEEEAWKYAAVRPFFPHGLGHMLGIQVHDVSGKQQNMNGAMFNPNESFPTLRNYRTVEVGNVFTIEPGIYFIENLLEELKSKHEEIKIDWELVAELIPLGGIRIEDNVYVGENGTENLTRSFLP